MLTTTIEVEIYDDPEYCDMCRDENDKFPCPHLYSDEPCCTAFTINGFYVKLEFDFDQVAHRKHEHCKAAWKRQKALDRKQKVQSTKEEIKANLPGICSKCMGFHGHDKPCPAEIPDSAHEWLAKGERGVSSETIFSFLTGVNIAGRYCHPYDPDDFKRCQFLLEAVPEFKARLKEMKKLSKEWSNLVDHWDELIGLMDEEVPGWREKKRGTAPKTYNRMKELIGD